MDDEIAKLLHERAMLLREIARLRCFLIVTSLALIVISTIGLIRS